MQEKIQIFIDTGGTFTDCMAVFPSHETTYIKVLSSSCLRGIIQREVRSGFYEISESWNLNEDIIFGYDFYLLGDKTKRVYKVIAYDACDKVIQLNMALPEFSGYHAVTFEITAHEEAPVLGIRLLTNTALGENFPEMEVRLGTTRGTNALLENKGAETGLIITKGFRDLLHIGNQQRPDIFALEILKAASLCNHVYELEEETDTNGNCIRKANAPDIHEILIDIRAKKISSIAIAFINSYANNHNELLVKKLAGEHKLEYISVSSELSSLIKILERAKTAAVNAYLSPVMHSYLSSITKNIGEKNLTIMTSAGSLESAAIFKPKDSLLSGPAGGVVGALVSGKKSGFTKLISFDMGGTSTDVSRIENGFDYVYDQKIGNAQIMAPAIAIETVAAGGGSICGFDGYRLFVGPESAGAFPGPACYGAGGPLTITDVNLLSGKLLPENFSIPIYPEMAEKRLNELMASIHAHSGQKTERREMLQGFLSIADEIMAGAIRKISVSRGYNPSEYCLLSFGGAGGMHACNIAELLHINTIVIPRESGLLSAYGIGNAAVERIETLQLLKPFKTHVDSLHQYFNMVHEKACKYLATQGIPMEKTMVKKQLLFLRFKGQDTSLEIDYESGKNALIPFQEQYKRLFGYWPEGKEIEIESIRILVSERMQEIQQKQEVSVTYVPDPVFYHDVKSPVYHLKYLRPGAYIHGPAIILDAFSTIYLKKNWELKMDAQANTVLQNIHKARQSFQLNEQAELELFTNRFMAIAENMGAMMQRTSFSVNIKERLDFSCALLDADGYLVANAPHIPVHLGSLGICVRSLISTVNFQEGDTLITNHPGFGGSHLPDVTLITPVYVENQRIAFVVNRAHHSEIGGISPGSMPPAATCLAEEGVVIKPFFLIREGITHWEHLQNLLEEAPFPSRSVDINLADVHAAIASNMKGRQDLITLCRLYGKNKVVSHFRKLKQYATHKMAEKLSLIKNGTYSATEELDNGACIAVKMIIKGQKCHIDFTGSAAVQQGNMNATKAIVYSVVLYFLRLLLNENIPLNDGLLENISLHIPDGMLNPRFDEDPFKCPAVVGGNVEISQRLTDTLLKAMQIMAASQGTMNNVIFGNNSFGYYETLAGGTGAGDGFNGTNAVHHHMTNTRITDPEIIEQRFPVKIRRMEIREDSGGKGRWHGGNGLIREYEFLTDINLSVLTQRRKSGPYGMNGGSNGKPGKQSILTKTGEMKMLEGIDTINVHKGDRFIIETPGGGGYGSD